MRAVIFDLDGTLIDTEEVLDSCIVEACTSFGATPSRAQLASVRGFSDEGPNGWPTSLLAQLQFPAPPPSPAALFSAVDALFLLRAPSAALLPGVADLVAALSAAGIPIAICTSSMRRHYDLKRSAHQASVFRHFSHAVCVDDVGDPAFAKPHPRPYLLAASLLGLPPGKCVAVEDSIPGITSALAAGCAVVAVPSARDAAAARALGAHAVLSSLAEWDFSGAGLRGGGSGGGAAATSAPPSPPPRLLPPPPPAADAHAPDAVRSSCSWVCARASHVALEELPLRALAGRLGEGLQRAAVAPPWDEHGWHWCGDAMGEGGVQGPRTSHYVLVLNALNWCFWPSSAAVEGGGGGGMEYENLARGLKAVMEANPAAFDADRLAATSPQDLAEWVPGIPDPSERAARVREVGRVLLKKFEGSGLALIATCGGSAVALVGALAALFPGFRDESVYVGPGGEARQVFFYKRAQILVGDLWGAYGRRVCTSGEGGGWSSKAPVAFYDIGELTCFADYRIPQLLEARGVLVYAPALKAKVEGGVELAPGGAEEVEIRAATVVAVERVRGVLKALHGAEVTAVELDWLLWNEGEVESANGKLPKHHRTRSVFY